MAPKKKHSGEAKLRDEPSKVSNPIRSFGLMLFSNIFWVFAINLYSSFIGLYVRSYGANPIEVGLYQTVLLLSVLIWIGVGGLLTTRFGEKPVLIISWGSIVPAPLIYLLAPTWQWTLLGAVCEGSMALAAAPIGSYISHLISGKRRGLAFTLLTTSSAIGGIPGPILGGWLIETTGFSSVFSLAAIMFSMSTLLMLPISKVPRQVDDSEKRWSRGFLRNRVFIVTTVLWTSIMTLGMVANFFVPLFLSDHFGLQETQIGILSAIVNMSAAFFGPLIGIAGDKWGHTKILLLPVTTVFCFYGALVFCPSVAILPAIYVFNGLTGTGSLLSAIISNHITKAQQPNAFAVFSFVGRILTPVSPILGGLGYSQSPALPLLIVALFLPLPASLVGILHHTQKKSEKLVEID